MYTLEQIINHIFTGNVLENLYEYPDNSIDMIITSPPYYGLRSYETINQIWDGDLNCQHEWETFIRKGITGGKKSKKIQIKGQENFQVVTDSEQAFCKNCGAWLGELGREPKYELYLKHLFDIFNECWRILKDNGTLWINLGDSYSNKSLIGIPDRLKIAMIDDGWICRNEIIWHKPNQFPSPIKDRFTVDFEKIFYFSKQKNTYFVQQFEPYVVPLNRGKNEFDAKNYTKYKDTNAGRAYRPRLNRPNPKGKNKRTVWSINTTSYKGAHFAVFPEKLIETPILAGCPVDGIVLDPFMGSGTVGVVAKKLERNWSGIELNPIYTKDALERINKE